MLLDISPLGIKDDPNLVRDGDNRYGAIFLTPTATPCSSARSSCASR